MLLCCSCLVVSTLHFDYTSRSTGVPNKSLSTTSKIRSDPIRADPIRAFPTFAKQSQQPPDNKYMFPVLLICSFS